MNRCTGLGWGTLDSGGISAAGAVLGARIGVGTSVEIAGRSFRVVRTLPPSASADDLAVFVRLDEMQAALGSHTLNQPRIHMAPGADAGEAVRRLRAAAPLGCLAARGSAGQAPGS